MVDFPELPLPFGNFNQDDPKVKFWTFVVYTWVVAIVSLFYFFYLSRALGQITGRLLCIYTWRKYKAWIELESVQFAPLSGKLMFRNLRYFSRNESFHVLRGHITFRYWLTRVRKEGHRAGSGPQDLPCRIRIRLDGLEWFIYNRTPAYEYLQSVLERLNRDPNQPQNASDRPENVTVTVSDELPSSAQKDMMFRWILPIEMSVSTGAITVGLPDLPSILIIYYKDAVGAYETVQARSLYDYYRTDLNLSFKKVKVSLRPNVDYREPVLNQAARIRSHNAKRPWYSKLAAFITGGIIWGGMKEEDTPLQDAERHWAGLSRYKVANVPLLKRRRFEEYAKVTNVLECKRLELRYYADVPGPVPARDNIETELSTEILNEETNVGNGDLPPEWGIDATVTDGQLHYGPWADRQRAMMQAFFFPVAYRNGEKTARLEPGAIRLFVALKLLVKFQGETTLRIPFREQSKDWRYYDDALGDDDANANVKVGSTGRPYAWMDLKVRNTSTVDIMIPFVQNENGYTTFMNVMLGDMSLNTSLNYAVLLSAQNLKLDCHMHNPLQWNGEREWTFNFLLNHAQLYLLRDHVTLLTDLTKDWTSGPATTLQYFIPMEYKVKVTLTDFDMFFCVNQNNVINQPNDLNENAYLIVSGPRMRMDFTLPFLRFEQEATAVGFQIESKKTRVKMSFPASHTIGALMTEQARDVGMVGQLAVDGTYRYCAAVKATNIDRLTINVEASAINAVIYGFLITHLIYFKENYMGEFNSFMTSDEYRSRAADPIKAETAWRKQEAAKGKSNLFEVYVMVTFQEGAAILPENLYDIQNVSVLTISEIQLENRNNDHYHDIQINIWPIYWTRGQMVDGVVQPYADNSRNFMHIEDVTIRGHRLFGLPPKGAVYAVDWRLAVGPITSEIQPSSIPALQRALDCFAFHYADVDNIIAPYKTPPDITTVQLVVRGIAISIWGPGSVTTVRLPHGLRIQTDNLVCQSWGDRTFIEIPEILLQCLAVTAEKEDITKVSDYTWVEVLNCRTALSVCFYAQTPVWKEAQARQIEFIRAQDETTKRCSFLYQGEGDTVYGAKIRQSYRSNTEEKWLPYLPSFSPPFQLGPNQPINRQQAARKRNIYADTSSGWSDESSESEAEMPIFSDDEVDLGLEGVCAELDGDVMDHDFGENRQEQLFSEPPPARSIPYRSYLKRFRIDLHNRDASYGLSGGSGPPMTSFIPIDAEETDQLHRDDSFYMERPFNRTIKRHHPHETEPLMNRDDEERSWLTIDFSQPIKILATPIILRILREALENLASEEANPESIMDEFQRKYTNDFIRIFNWHYIALSFFISAPSIQIHCIQDILLPDVTTFVRENQSPRYTLSDKLLCSFDIALTGLTARLNFTSENATMSTREAKIVEANLHLEVDTITTKLRFVGNMSVAGLAGIPPAKQHSRAPTEGILEGILEGTPVVLDLLAEKIQWKGHMNRRTKHGIAMSISTKELSVLSINETIEIMFGAIFKWVTFGADIANMLDKFNQRQQVALQHLITSIAEKARATKVDGDPIFLTQPTTIWMLGSRKHQEDSGWKLISHLRYCMRALPHSIQNEIKDYLCADALPSDNPKQLYSTTLRCLGTWRQWEINNLATVPLLRSVFNVNPVPPLAPGSTEKAGIKELMYLLIGEANLDISRLSVTVYDFQNDTSSVILGPIVFSAISALQNLESIHAEEEAPGSSMDALAGSTDSMVPVEARGSPTLDVRWRGRIERIDAFVNPNLLAFVRHFLRVHRWFQTRLESARKNSTVEEARQESTASSIELNILEDLPVTTFGTGYIANLSLTAAAHNLVAKATIRDSQVSTLHNMRFQSNESKARDNQKANAPTERTESDHPSELLHNSIVTVGAIDISMFERDARTLRGRNVTLVSVELNDITGTASIIQDLSLPTGGFVSGSNEKLSLALGVRHIGLRLPRSLLKLHAFLEKWGDEDLPRYDFLFNKLIREWDSASGDDALGSLNRSFSSKLGSHSAPPFAEVNLDILLSHLSIQSDLIASLSFFYDAHDLLIGIGQEELTTPLERNLMLTTRVRWEARLATHMLKFLAKDSASTRADDSKSSGSEQWTSFTLPTVSSAGSVSQSPRSSVQSTPADSLEVLSQQSQYHALPRRVEATLELDRVEASLDVGIIDHLITTQSVLGGELNDILEMLAFYAKKKRRSPNEPNRKRKDFGVHVSNSPMLLYALKVTVQGLQIATESPGSIIMFEADAMNGFIMNFPQKELSRETLGMSNNVYADRVFWRFSARRFSLSLVRNTERWQNWLTGNRTKMYPLAYVVASITVQNHGATEGAHSQNIDQKNIPLLCVRFHKLHVVFQPTAMPTITDAAVYYKKELDRRREAKAKEIQRAKENTQRFFNSINVPLPNAGHNRTFLEERIIILEVKQIGAAMPLNQEQRDMNDVAEDKQRVPGGRRSTTSSSTNHTVPALLISAKAIALHSRQLSSASGKIIDLCFQFVPTFDAANERHFNSSAHPTSNRILLHNMNAEVVRTKTKEMNSVRLNSGIKGFEMEVDATITEYANQLNAIYVREREKVVLSLPVDVGQSSADLPASTHSVVVANVESLRNNNKTGHESSYLSFDGRFEFETGTCKVWSWRTRDKSSMESPALSISQISSAGSTSQNTGEAGTREDAYVHVLTLPGITLLAMGKTTLGNLSIRVEQEDRGKGVHLELIIHPSSNIFHPDILFFIQEVNANLKLDRIIKHQEAMQGSASASSTSMVDEKSLQETVNSTSLLAYQRHKITFYLRLSHTKIGLSCQPISKVSCNLNLDEADFLFSFVPKNAYSDKSQYLSCTANIIGTSAAIRHAFSPEDCLNAEIPRVTFNVTMRERKANRLYAIELGMPALQGNLNARHLQDYFLFQRIWLGSPTSAGSPPSYGTSLNGLLDPQKSYRSSLLSLVENAHTLTDTINIAARINQIEFAMDFGQAIGKSTLALENLIGSGSGTRSAIGFQKKTLSVKFETLSFKSEGKLSGVTMISGVHAYLNVREPAGAARGQDISTVGVESVIRVEYLSSQLQYQYERILILHIAPIYGGLTDWWTSNTNVLKLMMDVDFTVDTFKGIMSRRTIPTIIHLAGRIRALIDEKRAVEVPGSSQRASRTDGPTLNLTARSSGPLLGKEKFESPLSSAGDVSEQSSDNQSGHGRTFLTCPWGDVALVARIKAVLGEAFIVLTRYNFRDPEFAQVVSKRIEIKYEGAQEKPNRAAETTSLHLSGFNIKKGTAKPVSQTEESMWNTAQWFAFMTSAATKNVFGVPVTDVALQTETYLTYPKVEYSFRTDFSGPIDVALNFGLYKYLQELVQLYQKAVLGSGEAKKEDGTSNAAPSATNTAASPSRVSPAQSSSSGSASVPSPTGDGLVPLKSPTRQSQRDRDGPTNGTSAEEEQALQFICKGETVFEPQLKVTGDATPWEWVEWLGVHKAKVPRLVYDQVTVNLTDVLDMLSGLHRAVAIPMREQGQIVDIDQ